MVEPVTCLAGDAGEGLRSGTRLKYSEPLILSVTVSNLSGAWHTTHTVTVSTQLVQAGRSVRCDVWDVRNEVRGVICEM